MFFWMLTRGMGFPCFWGSWLWLVVAAPGRLREPPHAQDPSASAFHATVGQGSWAKPWERGDGQGEKQSPCWLMINVGLYYYILYIHTYIYLSIYLSIIYIYIYLVEGLWYPIEGL